MISRENYFFLLFGYMDDEVGAGGGCLERLVGYREFCRASRTTHKYIHRPASRAGLGSQKYTRCMHGLS